MNEPVTYAPMLRFAVAAFDTWGDVEKTVRALGDGKALSNITFLGLQHILMAVPDTTPRLDRRPVRELPFPGNAKLIGCTCGPVAERLAGRLSLGAQTLQAALNRWLIPRHAAHLQDAVEQGKIVVWVQLFDNDDEQRAYQSLFAKSSNSVGVHDLVGT